MRLIASVCALALTALPLSAQTGNGSDVFGPGLPTGGIGGGTYEGGGFRRSDNAVFRTPNGVTIWSNGEVACAVSAAIPMVEESLRQGPLNGRAEAGGRLVGDAARDALWQVMRGDSVDRSGAAAALAAGLRGDASPRSRLGRRAQELVTALTGLLGKGAVCPLQRDLVVAEPWEHAVQSYDRFLDARQAGSPPGDATAAVHAVLSTLMQAALAAASHP